MKRTLGILLIFIFVLAFVASYLYLHNQKKNVRKEIKHKIIEGIDKEDLVYFVFTDYEIEHDLEWEHSKEFEYKGEMYDVVEKKKIGAITHFWCWWDHEETKLNKQLNKLVFTAMGNNQTNKENNKRLLAFYKSLYCSVYADLKVLCAQKKELIPIFNCNYKSKYFPPPVPPPIFS